MKKADNFNPGKWLIENKLTNQSRLNEKVNEGWDDENWLLRNNGIDYKGKIKDIVNVAKKYPLVDIELSRVGESPNYDDNEIERASKADYTKFPIVAVELEKAGKDSVGVLDGNHRVYQARKDGETKLKGYLIPLKDIEKYIINK
jgi:hypothetical protein